MTRQRIGRFSGHLAPLAGRGARPSSAAVLGKERRSEASAMLHRRCNPGEGSLREHIRHRVRGATPHPNPLRASFARLDPAKSGAREKTRYSVTGLSEICQSLPSKVEMWSVFIGE